MTKLFVTPLGFLLARNPDDVRAVSLAYGRIKVACDLPDNQMQEVTKQVLTQHGKGLQALLDANKRGLAYPDPNGWVCIPLSSECEWLHHNATELVECPACGAFAGQPCSNTEEHPIYEGTAHRRRVRALVLENPEVLDHSLLKD